MTIERAESCFDRKHLPSLDGLRFLALAQVVLYHGGISHVPGDGVMFFFVLSGFLFAWLLDRERRSTGTVSLKRFYTRRLLRIVPAFYVAIVFTIVGKRVLGFPVDYAHAFSSFTFTANYYNAFHDHPATGFSSFWSLAVEEQFYLVWPLAFLLFTRFGRRAVLAFLGASVVLVCAWRSVVFLSFDIGTAYVYNAFETRFDSLGIGCLAGLLVCEDWFRRLVDRLSQVAWAPLATMTLMVLIENVGSSFRYSIGMTIEGLLMAVLLLQLIRLAEHPMWRWLNSRGLVFLGALSYSGYLYHHWGLALGHRLTPSSVELQVAIGLAVTLILALASYRFVEQPFLSLKARFAAAR